MPFIKIQTNQTVATEENFLKKLSAAMAEKLGKPESYIMTALQPDIQMSFAGNSAKTAFVEVKSIGLDRAATAELSDFICDFIENELAIEKSRVYIEFTDSPGAMWGWNGGTF